VCVLQPEEVRVRAHSDKDAKKRAPGTLSPRRRAALNASVAPLAVAIPAELAPSTHTGIPPYASGSSSDVVWPAELDLHTSNRQYHPYSPVPSIMTHSPASTPPDGLSPSDSASMVASSRPQSHPLSHASSLSVIGFGS